jgi:hypothetical protein
MQLGQAKIAALSIEGFDASPELDTILYNFRMDSCCPSPCSRTYV